MVCIVHHIFCLVILLIGALSLLYELAHAVSKLVLRWIQEHKDTVDEFERSQANLAKLAHSLILVLISLFVIRAEHHDKVRKQVRLMNQLEELESLRIHRQVLIKHVLW